MILYNIVNESVAANNQWTRDPIINIYVQEVKIKEKSKQRKINL